MGRLVECVGRLECVRVMCVCVSLVCVCWGISYAQNLTCESPTSTGSVMTYHMTPSEQGGVVNDPW